MSEGDASKQRQTEPAAQLGVGSKPDTTSSPPLKFEDPGGVFMVEGLPRPVPREVGWQVIQLMRRLTPKGARRPWRTAKNIDFVLRVVAEGARLEDIQELLRDAKEMIEAGVQDPKFWHLSNLLEGVTCERWVADQGPWAARRAARAQAELDAAALVERHRQETLDAAQTTPAIRSIEVARMAREVIGRMGRARNEEERDKDAS